MKHGSLTSVTVGATSQAFIGANPTRVALTLFPPATGNITLTTAATAVQFQGIILNQGQAPVRLNYDDIGNLVQSSWNAIADAGGRVVGVIEVIEAP